MKLKKVSLFHDIIPQEIVVSLNQVFTMKLWKFQRKINDKHCRKTKV